MVVETIINGLSYHFSDEGKKLLQVETGIVYDDAYDIRPCPYTYEETEEDVEGEDTAEEILDILFGEDGR